MHGCMEGGRHREREGERERGGEGERERERTDGEQHRQTKAYLLNTVVNLLVF